ncbi:MAG TPA: DUF3054 domain-containing protein [Kineosporiaceae bacterium]
MSGRTLDPPDLPEPSRLRAAWLGAGADLLAVVVFAALGRRAHDEGSALTGTLATAGPFLVGAGAAWLGMIGTSAVRRRDGSSLRSGLLVVVVTVAMGMLLRHAAGRGTPLPFVIVATTFLGLALLGWRVGVRAVTLRRRRRPG